MDSLIVLRKPLRRPHVGPKFTIPKKSKKVAPKVEPVPVESQPQEPAPPAPAPDVPAVCFVQLYAELCRRRAGRRRARRHNTPAGARAGGAALAAALSDASLTTRAPRRARADLMLELDYASSFLPSEYS